MLPYPDSLAGVLSGFRRTQGVLAFYATVLGLVEAGVVGVTAILADKEELRYLIPWVLAFGAIVLVGLIGVVVVLNVRTPMKLQLGQVSGRELIEYEQMTLGNSASGEYVERVPVVIPTSGAEPTEYARPAEDQGERR